LDNGRLPRKQKLKMVQVLVAEMIERFGDRLELILPYSIFISIEINSRYIYFIH
jgi:hypothetical protein